MPKTTTNSQRTANVLRHVVAFLQSELADFANSFAIIQRDGGKEPPEISFPAVHASIVASTICPRS